MKIFSRNEEAVSPVIGVILMVAITVILAAVIAAFVFGLGGQQTAAPTASIVASNAPDTPVVDMKIQHKGGDLMKGGEYKLSIVPVGQSPTFVISQTGSDLGVGAQIITYNATNYAGATAINLTNSNLTSTGGTQPTWNQGDKYDVKLVHVPSNAMLLDQVVEVR